jgi:hypothetical protein
MTEVQPIRAKVLVRPLSQEEVERGLQAMSEARQTRQRMVARRGGKPFPSSWQLIREAREERASRL